MTNRPLLAAGGAWDRELTRLRAERDRAAYRVVAAVKVVLDFFEAQDFASAEQSLRDARAAFDLADARLAHFHNSQPKKEQSNGNRTSAA